MGRNKTPRSMAQVGESQQITEERHSSKFEEARLSAEEPKKQPKTGRKSPMVGFTITEDDKQTMDKLTLYVSNKKGKIISKSALQRELIRIGNKYKDEIDCE